MDISIKKDLASNWFKLLQNAICDDILKIEKNKVNLEFISDKTTNANWTLYNELGKSILKGKQKLYNGENSIGINLKNVKNGVYFVSLEVDGKIITKQIIKN